MNFIMLALILYPDENEIARFIVKMINNVKVDSYLIMLWSNFLIDILCL